MRYFPKHLSALHFNTNIGKNSFNLECEIYASTMNVYTLWSEACTTFLDFLATLIVELPLHLQSGENLSRCCHQIHNCEPVRGMTSRLSFFIDSKVV